MYLTVVASSFGLQLFLILVTILSLWNVRSLFLISFRGANHRWSGAALLIWHLVGVFTTATTTSFTRDPVVCRDGIVSALSWLCFYDLVLGSLGILTTWTAAQAFPHLHVQNAKGQSGVLSAKATVTQAEMMEHIFYHGLNLVQIIYMHCIRFSYYYYQKYFHYKFVVETKSESTSADVFIYLISSRFVLFGFRLAAISAVTSPWLIRHWFPVHSFSANWKLASASTRQTESSELWLYRIKKMQYLFYKHFILHGMNFTMAVHDVTQCPTSSVASMPYCCDAPPWNREWRIFWLALNISYVMEFYLQTLVKRKKMHQIHMLWLQRLLMTASTCAAIFAVLPVVTIPLCLLSLCLNLVHRRHDFVNTMVVFSVAVMWNEHFGVQRVNKVASYSYITS